MNQGISLNDLTYDRINKDIMNLVLEPGSAVSIQKLADAYQVSRTPVREAVIRLEKKGLVEIYPQAKTIISKINLKRIHQERFIRKALEIAAVDSFIQNCDEATVHVLEGFVSIQKDSEQPDYYEQFFRADNNFHRVIFETAKEDLSWSTINDVVSHYNRFRLLSTRLKGVNTEIIDEHDRIIKAAEYRNASAMKEILELHLGKIQREIGSLLEAYPDYFVEA